MIGPSFRRPSLASPRITGLTSSLPGRDSESLVADPHISPRLASPRPDAPVDDFVQLVLGSVGDGTPQENGADSLWLLLFVSVTTAAVLPLHASCTPVSRPASPLATAMQLTPRDSVLGFVVWLVSVEWAGTLASDVRVLGDLGVTVLVSSSTPVSRPVSPFTTAMQLTPRGSVLGLVVWLVSVESVGTLASDVRVLGGLGVTVLVSHSTSNSHLVSIVTLAMTVAPRGSMLEVVLWLVLVELSAHVLVGAVPLESVPSTTPSSRFISSITTTAMEIAPRDSMLGFVPWLESVELISRALVGAVLLVKVSFTTSAMRPGSPLPATTTLTPSGVVFRFVVWLVLVAFAGARASVAHALVGVVLLLLVVSPPSFVIAGVSAATVALAFSPHRWVIWVAEVRAARACVLTVALVGVGYGVGCEACGSGVSDRWRFSSEAGCRGVRSGTD